MYAQHQYPIQGASPYISAAHPQAQAQLLAHPQAQAQAQTIAYLPHLHSHPPAQGTPQTAHLHPQLPQLNSYPHLQLQYAYAPVQGQGQVRPHPQPGATVHAGQVAYAGQTQGNHLSPHPHSVQLQHAQALQIQAQQAQRLQAQYAQSQPGHNGQMQNGIYAQPRPQVFQQSQPHLQPQPQPQLQSRPIARQPSSQRLIQRVQQQPQPQQPASRPHTAVSAHTPVIRNLSQNLAPNHATHAGPAGQADGMVKPCRKASSHSATTTSRAATPNLPSPIVEDDSAESGQDTEGSAVNGANGGAEDREIKTPLANVATTKNYAGTQAAGEGDAIITGAIPPHEIPYYDKSLAMPTVIQPPFSFYGQPLYAEMGEGRFEGAYDPGVWLDHEGTNAHPLLQPGSAVEALIAFVEGLHGMAGGSYAEWKDFLEDHFDDSSRLQLTLPSHTGLTLHDIPRSSLGRIFSSFPASLRDVRLHLHGHDETPLWSVPESPSEDLAANSLPRHGVQVDSEGEWRWRYATTRPTESRIEKRRPKDGNVDERAILDIVWKVSVTSTWVPVIEEGVLKMETMEVFVHVVDIPMGLRELVQGSGLPGNIIQILQIVSEMEDMMDIIELSQEGYVPRDALKALTAETVKIQPTSVGEKDEGKTPQQTGSNGNEGRDAENTAQGSHAGLDEPDPMGGTNEVNDMNDIEGDSWIKADETEQGESRPNGPDRLDGEERGDIDMA